MSTILNPGNSLYFYGSQWTTTSIITNFKDASSGHGVSYIVSHYDNTNTSYTVDGVTYYVYMRHRIHAVENDDNVTLEFSPMLTYRGLTVLSTVAGSTRTTTAPHSPTLNSYKVKVYSDNAGSVLVDGNPTKLRRLVYYSENRTTNLMTGATFVIPKTKRQQQYSLPFIRMDFIDCNTNTVVSSATATDIIVTVPALPFEPQKVQIKVNGMWQSGELKAKVNGAWVDAESAYVKVNGMWMEIDSE